MKTQNLRVKSGDPVSVISNLFKEAINSKGPFVKSKFAVDPINSYAEKAFGIKVSSDDPKHPLDIFYDSLEIELKSRPSFDKTTGRRDPVNNIEIGNITGKAHLQASQKINEILDSIKKLYQFSTKSITAIDPVNDQFFEPDEITRKFGNPKHNFNEMTALIGKFLGPAFRKVDSGMCVDPINDLVANMLGIVRPSEKNLSLVKDKLFNATYELNYKLTPGSEAYNKKAAEIEDLKKTRKILIDRLEETEPKG